MLPTPPDILNEFPPTRGGVRKFFENVLLPPISKKTQKHAGHASASQASSALALRQLAEEYQMDKTALLSGMQSVSGAEDAAGGHTILNTPNPDIPVDKGAAAFFDVDNTLVRGASIILFAKGLYKRKYFTTHEILPQLWKQVKFRLSGTENMGDVEQGRKEALEFVKGKSVDEIKEIAKDVFTNDMQDRIWEGTRALAEKHLEDGQQVWLVTATPVELAQVIAKELGFTGALGTVAASQDGYYTGELQGDILHGEGKKYAVAALAAHQNLDLSRCTAYSDSSNDIPMLSMVGNPVAINPDHKLKKYSQKKGWPMYDFRNGRKLALDIAGGTALAGALGAGAYALKKTAENSA